MPEPSPHYLLITVGSTGDVHPFMQMARTLQDLGRTVTLITNSHHARLVQDAGLPFVGVGNEAQYRRIIENPNLWDEKKSVSAIMLNFQTHIEQMIEAIRSVGGAQKIVIAHPFAIPAAAIARECKLLASIVGVCLAPSNLRSCHDPLTIGATSVPRWVPMRWRRAFWRYVDKNFVDPFAVGQINAVREPQGLLKVESLMTHMAQVPDLWVTLFPAWFAPPVPDWPPSLVQDDFPLFDGRQGEAVSRELSAFLAAGEKPLVFTPGTKNFHAADFFTQALAAVNRLGRRAIFLTSERMQVPENLPASVLWQSYVPLGRLLPHASALIHHGGIGTTAEALRCGIPQLITPFAWDQFDNGARVVALGAGMVLPAKGMRSGKLARRLTTLLVSEDIRAHSTRLAAHFNPSRERSGLFIEIERLALARAADRGAMVRPDKNTQVR